MEYEETDYEEIWNDYKDDWENGKSPTMDPELFTQLFTTPKFSEEAVDLIRSSPPARKTLVTVTEGLPAEIISELADEDLFKVWIELWGEDSIDELMISGREEIDRVDERMSFVTTLVYISVDHFGRAWVRNRFQRWWREANFAEEEREELLKSLARRKVLNWWSLNALGVDAVEITRKLLWRGAIRPEWIESTDVPELTLQGSRPGNQWGRRLSALLHSVSLPLDLRDSRLQLDELTRLNNPLTFAPTQTILNRALERLRHDLYPEEWESVAFALAQLGNEFVYRPPSQTELPFIRFPLIRFLHLRLLLETPSLRSALLSPEEFLVPEVLTYTLGHDHVSYFPALRVFRELDRRWRARWAESAGEAISIIFLESTVDLDLTTLARIPETSDQTPDFLVRTVNDESIVFEAKGATAWQVHLKQRKTALKQLQKRRSKSRRTSVVGSGRGFAFGLFAARQGDLKDSSLHVDDPPFPFEYLFHEGWMEEARRSHFAAVLEAAQFYEMAENLRRRQLTERTPEELRTFSIGDRRDRFPNFIGTFLPVQDIARRLQHPDMKAVERIRIFVGVHEQIFNDLKRGKLPGELGTGAPPGNAEEAGPISAPPWGVLPGREVNLPARGVYSSLPDGSFMAVEIE